MILESLKDQMQDVFNSAIPKIEQQIRVAIKNSLQAQPEYEALTRGNLRFELGVPDSQDRTDSIIDAWISNVSLEKSIIKMNNHGLTGGFSLSMISSDFADVLMLPAATVTDESNGYSLPWLKWLLLDGGKIIVKDYSVVFGPNRASRTGFAIMKKDKSSNWRVPAEFAGTISSNWVTRAIDSLDESINNIIQAEIERAII
jgi:hypothetical protein